MTQYLDLKSLDPSHPLRNRPLGEIGAEVLFQNSSVWYGLRCECRSYNELTEVLRPDNLRAPLETKT